MKIIGIGGGAGSGKTSAAKYVQGRLGEDRVELLSLDDYYFHPNEYNIELAGFVNWDIPEALNWANIRSDFAKLISGQFITTPYDSDKFEVEKNDRVSRGRVVQPKEILIVEGLYALLDATLISLYASKIFLDASFEVRFGRRARYIMTAEYIHVVHIPMYENYVLPTMNVADLVLDANQRSAQEVGDSLLAHVEALIRT